MTDDRRERYAAALAASEELGWDLIRRQYPLDVPLYLRNADAAMAVADVEHTAQFRSYEQANNELHQEQSRLVDENARLREELDTANRHLDARRIELLRVNERHAAAIEGLSRALARNQMRVERVRAVLDFCDRGSAMAIRAALEGES